MPGGPLGVTFSPEGELFVTSHYESRLSRFIFDENGNAVSNGFITTTGQLGGVAIGCV